MILLAEETPTTHPAIQKCRKALDAAQQELWNVIHEPVYESKDPKRVVDIECTRLHCLLALKALRDLP